MPMGASEGDFISVSLSNGNNLSGLIFNIPSEEDRDYISTLLAIFPSTKYDLELLKRNFKQIIISMKNKDKMNFETLKDILAPLFTIFQKGKGKLKIDRDLIISIDVTPKKEEDTTDKVKKFSSDIWG